MAGWAFFHGFLGVVLLAGLVVSIWLALSTRRFNLRALRISTVTITVAVVLKNLLGDILYMTYRSGDPDSPRSLILAGDYPWLHTVLMEFKEHAAHFLPLILLVAVAMLYVYKTRLKDESNPRRVFVSLLALTLIITLVVLIMGAAIAQEAPLR